MDILNNTDNLKEFTPIPFWFWNDELSKEEIKCQMLEMKEKGVDGFVIHPRKGLPGTIKYLSEEYFYFVKYAVELAKEMDMKVVLYDEAMYPSGSCHGEVVKSNPEFASKGLKQIKDGDDYKYELVYSGGTIRGVHEDEDDGQANAPKSADLLNPKAVHKFIELTHEKYYSELSEYFGDTVIAFFTDEPNILGRNFEEGLIPWSEGIMDEFVAAGGSKADLKYLFVSDDDDFSNAKDKALEIYKKVIHERLSKSYYKQLSDWCTSHGIALTGHPEKSTDIGYLDYFQIPCQDIVWRFVEPEEGHAIEGEHSTMGKCSSDSARHRGKRRNGNECFGCCGQRNDPYLFTENDMKWYLNWLFIRGVNLVYPHAFYYSVRDGRGDERPPEVGLHNPFWPHYHKMSDYIKRMCYLNTNCVNCAQVAILCSEDELSWKFAKPLFTHQVEFNYLERALLPKCRIEQRREDKNKTVLSIEKQSYSVIVADKKLFESLESSQRRVLDDFAKEDGAIIIMDEEKVLFKEEEYLDMVLFFIDREVVFKGNTYDLRFTHLVKDNNEYMLLSNEGMNEISFDIELKDYNIIKVYDPYTCEEFSPSLQGLTLKPYTLMVSTLKK